MWKTLQKLSCKGLKVEYIVVNVDLSDPVLKNKLLLRTQAQNQTANSLWQKNLNANAFGLPE